MNPHISKWASRGTILLLVALAALIGCAAPAATPVPPTQAPPPATAVPAAAPTQAQPTQVPPTQAPPTTAPTSAATAAPSGAAADRAKTLILDTEGGKVADSKNYNPYAQGRGGSNGLVQALIEPIFTTNEVTGKIEPWLGDTMTPNADFTKWTLTLKKGIEWSDGQPLNADDLIFTVNMIQKFPDLSTGGKFKDVTMKKVDDQTVEFTLKQGDPRFELTNFASNLESQELRIVPQHIWKDVADPVTFTYYDPAKGWPVFSGAWLLDKVVSDTEFDYKLNPNWWGAKTGFRPLPAATRIVWTLLGDENTRAAAIDKGDLDSMAIAAPSTFLTLQAKNTKIIAWSKNPPYGNPDVCDRNLEFNHWVKPWDDPDMRWAVEQAIDRSKLIEIAFAGFSSPSYNFLPDFRGLDHYRDLLDKAGFNAKYPIQKVDPAAAKAVFEKKGYTLNSQGIYEKGGQPLKVTITNFEDVVLQALGGTLIEQLHAVGIDARQDTQQIPTYVDNLMKGKFEMYIFFGSCGSTIDPWKSMDSYNVSHLVQAGQSIDGFYSNSWHWGTDTAKQYSALVDQIAKLQPGDPKIDDLYVKAMDLWYKELPGIPLVHNYLIWPNNTTYWTNWPTEDNPYIQPDMAGTNTPWILHSVKPAQ